MNNSIQTIRKKRKLSAKDLAKISNVSMQNIYDLENDVRKIEDSKLITLVRLSKALKVKVKDLVVDNSIKRRL